MKSADTNLVSRVCVNAAYVLAFHGLTEEKQNKRLLIGDLLIVSVMAPPVESLELAVASQQYSNLDPLP